jgi:hypothetical protein
VSAKVRQLDQAKSRVAECQQRVHDLIDLKRCSEGVTTALQVRQPTSNLSDTGQILSRKGVINNTYYVS